MLTNILSNIYYYIYPKKIPAIIPYLIGKNLETYLNVSDLHKIKLCNKELNDNIYLQKELNVKKSILSNYLQEWKKNDVYLYFKDTFFPEKLIKLLPVLPCKRNYVGCTDYIDGIRAKDLTHPIMIGVDHFRRPFITIRYDSHKPNLKRFERGHITVFQRYSDCKKKWVKCNSRGPLMLHDGDSTFTNDDKALIINNIIRLLCEKKIIVNYYEYIHNRQIKQTAVDCQLY